MKYVEIISYRGKFNDPPEKIGEVQLKKGEIVFVDIPPMLREELEWGIVVDGGKRITPRSPERFLEGLEVALSGSATRATEVKER